jgi:predicted adenine nucleotide alpha hydrolase (AANH) superfamily ATPase
MVAQTILQQIGGRRFAAMTGSRNFTDLGNGLLMSLAKNMTSANRLEIIYDEGADLYNMRFYRKTFSKKTFESKTKDIAKYKGVYFDMLEYIFTEVTGLDTRL